MYSIFKARRSEEDWRRENGRVLFTWSVINPNGPTLNCVGTRYCGCPGQVEVFYRRMHFLGGESFVLGYVSEDSNSFEAEVLEVLRYGFKQETCRAMPAFPLVACVPSFVTLPEQGDSRVISAIDARYLIVISRAFRESDWGRQMYYLEKYGSRLFDRAAEETRATMELAAQDPKLTEAGSRFLELTRVVRGDLSGFRDWQPNQYAPRPLEEGDIEKWWTTLTQQAFMTNCLIDLAQAWVGATYQARTEFPHPAEPFELVRDFLAFHQYSLWPEKWDSTFLRQRMNLNPGTA